MLSYHKYSSAYELDYSFHVIILTYELAYCLYAMILTCSTLCLTIHMTCMCGRRKVTDRSPPSAHEASREKPRGADPELCPGLRWTLDRMVVTEGMLVNLTLQLTRREN